MLLSQLLEKLSNFLCEHGDITVMIEDDSINLPAEVWYAKVCEVKSDDEYPKDFNMPAGFKFVKIGN